MEGRRDHERQGGKHSRLLPGSRDQQSDPLPLEKANSVVAGQFPEQCRVLQKKC